MTSMPHRCMIGALWVAGTGTAVAQNPDCDTNHQKFVNGGVAPAKMSVLNNGKPCTFSFKFEGAYDPDEWKVIEAPRHGKLDTDGSGARYLPESGYVGADAFVVELHGRDPMKRKSASRNGSFAFQVDVRDKP